MCDNLFLWHALVYTLFFTRKYLFFVLGTYLHYVEKLNENVRIFFFAFVTKNHDEMLWQKSGWYDICISGYGIMKEKFGLSSIMISLYF